MADGYQALSEREKEVLRLLLAGHDAKSMACQLGLSVHAINERLRGGRQKLGVSSSKAAARILREAETAAPETLVDKVLGDAVAPPDRQMVGPEPAAAPAARRRSWTLGGLAMIMLFAAALALSAPSALAPTPPAAASVAESDATRAARDWLALVDARNWPASYAATGDSFRQLNSLANWQAAAEQVHARLGPAVARQLLRDDDTPTPPNRSHTVRFRTDFATTKGVTEVLSLVREGDRWKVVGIYVE